MFSGNEIRYGLNVRYVQIDDAEFIVRLRTDPKLRRYISSTTESVEDQKEWIKQYKERESLGSEMYFIFLFQGKRVGLARIYNIENDHFTQGSWLFDPDAPVGCSILGNIISSEIGFELLGKTYLLTDARIGNNTHRYVRTFDPEVLQVTDKDVHYRISKENFDKNKIKHIKMCQQVLSANS